MTKHTLVTIFLLLAVPALRAQKTKAHYNSEIIYHVCQRSFYDSNRDLQGDIKGLQQKLGYLQNLGITAILLLPLYEADCYHNYFANDFDKIDQEFGTLEDYIALVKDIHRRGMKIYIDMETQYVAAKHVWWQQAVGNLASPYSDYLLFDDSAHKIPATMVFGLRQLNSYDGKVIPITTVNLKSKHVFDYNVKLFSYFADPNKDGKFDDGVDGFRLDHAMDNLDDKPTLTNLFAEFWKPLITQLKTLNPRLTVVAEQADWGNYGFDYFEKAGVDRMFGFNLRQAILSFNKQQLASKADSTLALCPAGKEQIIFLENHDLNRFASLEKNIQKQKLAAALMMFIGGVPSIYYGQELGMQGKEGAFGNTDGNSIPMREAFEWYRSANGKGMAFWYKNTGEWWNKSTVKANDGISLEEETNAPQSLFNYYKQIIALKQSNICLAFGKYAAAENNNSNVFSFYRVNNGSSVLVAANLSNKPQKVALFKNNKPYKVLLGNHHLTKQEIDMNPYEVVVLEVGQGR